MEKYEAIQEQIRKAHIQRSVYLAELLSEFLTDTWNGIKNVADIFFSVARAKNPKGIFTFDA
jgi:hypothetical protein